MKKKIFYPIHRINGKIVGMFIIAAYDANEAVDMAWDLVGDSYDYNHSVISMGYTNYKKTMFVDAK